MLFFDVLYKDLVSNDLTEIRLSTKYAAWCSSPMFYIRILCPMI